MSLEKHHDNINKKINFLLDPDLNLKKKKPSLNFLFGYYFPISSLTRFSINFTAYFCD